MRDKSIILVVVGGEQEDQIEIGVFLGTGMHRISLSLARRVERMATEDIQRTPYPVDYGRRFLCNNSAGGEEENKNGRKRLDPHERRRRSRIKFQGHNSWPKLEYMANIIGA